MVATEGRLADCAAEPEFSVRKGTQERQGLPKNSFKTKLGDCGPITRIIYGVLYNG